jgi:hypothetical protein
MTIDAMAIFAQLELDVVEPVSWFDHAPLLEPALRETRVSSDAPSVPPGNARPARARPD